MKIKFSYLSIIILILGLAYILVDFGPSVSILGNKTALLKEKKRLREKRETVEIRVDSISAFIKCICKDERLDCNVSILEGNLVCKFPIAKSREVESAFLCGLGRKDLKGRLDYTEDNDHLIFNFPINGEFVVLPSIFPACLPSKRTLCND